MNPIKIETKIKIILFPGLLLTALLFSAPGFTQEIHGTVSDSTGGAVPYASVNLISKPGDAILAYTTTDTRGGYVLRLPANAPPTRPARSLPSATSVTMAARFVINTRRNGIELRHSWAASPLRTVTLRLDAHGDSGRLRFG